MGKEADLNLYRQSADFPSNPKLLEAIYNCEFLGFVDQDHRKVGCLLHPGNHRGVDRRDNSFYGRELCAGHFCLSFTYLTALEQASVIWALDDWYLYGLVITDIDLVKGFLDQVQNRLGECLREKPLFQSRVKMALRDFFQLKESWKFAAAKNRLGKYFFSHGEYQIARMEYQNNWRMKPSNFEKILVSLASEFNSPEDVREAEFIIEEKIRKFMAAYQIASSE